MVTEFPRSQKHFAGLLVAHLIARVIPQIGICKFILHDLGSDGTFLDPIQRVVRMNLFTRSSATDRECYTINDGVVTRP